MLQTIAPVVLQSETRQDLHNFFFGLECEELREIFSHEFELSSDFALRPICSSSCQLVILKSFPSSILSFFLSFTPVLAANVSTTTVRLQISQTLPKKTPSKIKATTQTNDLSSCD